MGAIDGGAPRSRAGDLARRRVYLDFAATSPLSQGAQGAIRAAEEQAFGNPNSAHWAGAVADRVLESARAAVLRRAAVAERTVFTSGASESNWLAILGLLGASGAGRLLVSSVEHESVMATARYARSSGVQTAEIEVDRLGRVQLDHLQDLLRAGPAVVAVMHANNEVGTLQPVAEIAELIHSFGGTLHVDAVQSFGKVALGSLVDADTIAVSAHKAGGPKGVGGLLIRSGVLLSPPFAGGSQEYGLRHGTQNVPGIAGFARAAAESDPATVGPQLWARAESLRSALARDVPEIRFTGDLELRAPHIVSCIIPGVAGDVLTESLSALGVAASVGSACHADSAQLSHVLRAMGASTTEASCALRLSVGLATTAGDIDYAVWAISEAVRRLRSIVLKARGAGARESRPGRSRGARVGPQGGAPA